MNYTQLNVNQLLNLLSALINDLKYYMPFLIIVMTLFSLVYVIRRLLIMSQSFQRNAVILELTPPASTEKTAYTTQQLFSVLHNIGSQRTFFDKLIGRKILFSFEIVSTADQGIRYVLHTTPKEVAIIKRTIVAYLPHVQVKETSEYLPEKVTGKIIEFKLEKHFAFPLAKQDTLEEHDPVAYITGTMTKLKPNETIAFQLILSPIKTRQADILSQKIYNNEEVLNYLNKSQFSWYLTPFYTIILLLRFFGKELSWAVAELMHSTHRPAYISSDIQARLKVDPTRPARVLSNFEQQAVSVIQEKINQSLFEASIRAIVIVNNKQEQKERIRGIKSSLAPFTMPKHQAFQTKQSFPPQLIDSIRTLTFRKRMISLFGNKSTSLLSVSEVADLYHFPYTRVTQTENIVKNHWKELPAPLSLKQTDILDVVFAKNTYGGSTAMIGLATEERVRHMYIIGATGTGKSTMLLSMINQDIQNGKGICIVDPHGDLAETVLDCIPDKRVNDLIYFNPHDIKFPIGINLLELTPDLDEDDALIEKEFIAESVISLFRKVFSDSFSSHPHRIEYILRNTIHTAFTVENPTLFTIFDLLNNPPFQKKVVQNLQDENLKNFWKYEFGRAGDFQKVKMVAPVTARIGRFLFSPSAKRIMEQKKSTINFDEILDNKKLLICNLAKGNIGEDTSEVLGIMILNKIQLAALKRAKKGQKARNNFYLYVDEFQNFATPSFVQMLSEARKYGLNLIMAEQSTSQQNDRNTTNIILANVGTMVSFRSANPIDEELLLRQYSPYIERGDVANLPAFHFYMKTSALKPEEPFSGETMPVKLTVDKAKRAKLIASSRNQYAIEYKKKEINRTFTNTNLNEKSTRRGLPEA